MNYVFGTLAQPILYAVVIGTIIGVAVNILEGLEGVFEMFVYIDSSSAGSEHIEPIFSSVMQPLLIIGLVLFALILSWQAFKSMFSYMGFQEITEPWKLIVRGLAFVFLVFYSQEILALVVDSIFTPFIEKVESFSGATLNIFESLNKYMGASFLSAAFIRLALSIYLAFKLLGVTINLAQRLLLTSFMVAFAPLAFACGVSKSTLRYFTGYIKVFASVLVTQIVQVALLTTIMPFANENYFRFRNNLSSVFLGFFLIMAVFKIIRKTDEILRELGFAAPLANAKLDLMSQVISMSFVAQNATSFVSDFTSLGKIKKPSFPRSSQSNSGNAGGGNAGGGNTGGGNTGGGDAGGGDAGGGDAGGGDAGGGDAGD